MTDKQIIIDYKNICENYSPKVGCTGTFDGSCIKEQCFTYKLLQKLQAKEQECVELRTERKNLKWDLENNIQVKNHAREEINQLKQTLAEIKEIAEDYPLTVHAHELAFEQILQKISECEVEDDNA